MLNLLKKFNANLETMEAKKLLIVLLNIFVVFLLIGIVIGYFRDASLKEDELLSKSQNESSKMQKKSSYEGRVMIVDSSRFKEDGIKYALYDTSDKEIILLKTNDQKLDLLEGIFVGVKGSVVKSKDGKRDILIVSEVVMNASN